MIEFAPIVPTQYLEAISHRSNTLMAMAHMVLSDEQYAQYYRQSRESGNYIILDNSAYYFGSSVDPETLLKAISIINPNEFVIPDVLEDYQGTMEASLEFMNSIGDDLVDIRMMGVPQGATLEEYIACYRAFAAHPAIHSLGIGAGYVNEIIFGNQIDPRFLTGREYLIYTLVELGIINTQKLHHLLGLGSSGHLELSRLNQYSFIRSCDSSAPYLTARDGIQIKEGEPYEKPHIGIDFNAPINDVTFQLLLENIAVLSK